MVENSRFRTNLGINNLSSADANVNVTLVNPDGMVLARTDNATNDPGFSIGRQEEGTQLLLHR